MAKKFMSDDQTSEATLPQDGVSEVAEVHIDDGGSNINLEGVPEETEANEETPKETEKKPEIDYKERYAESTREAQRIISENKELRAKSEEKEARLAKLEEQFKSEKPEEYEAIKIKEELSSIKNDLVKTKEENELNSFIAENPEARNNKEALRKVGRSNPNQSYGELWETVVKPLQEAGIKNYLAKQASKKTSQPETGKDSSDTSYGGLTPSKFNKLSLAEQKKIIDKISPNDGIVM